MELANQIILVASGLILISIFAGTLSSRIGAPLLLVFLVLGMLAGEDGPGGIEFDDFGLTYTFGSVALAVILFDGGIRTRLADLRSVAAPALILATVGVIVTAGITGAAAKLILGVGWLEGMLLGSIVASTDAAAVFLLLHLRGLRLRDKLRAVLEAEAGLNDPMAIMLTLTCVTLLGITDASFDGSALADVAGQFIIQIAGGAVFGIVGGYLLLAVINRMTFAAGLYPIVAAAGALVTFAAAQEVGASGFLAAYLAGLVVGNRRHKATMLIDRFLDGLAWLCQIAMFLLLGLLVTPSSLVPALIPALLIALTLIFIARPVAVAVVLPWFGFRKRETAFVSWVGLRGAVPIFLGTIPVLSGIPGAETVFGVVYVIVMASLVVQGWTVGAVSGRLGVSLPPRPDAPPRVGMDLPSSDGRDMNAYAVQAGSLAVRRPLARLPIPDDVNLICVFRDDNIFMPDAIGTLAMGDDVLLVAPAERQDYLDRLFGAGRHHFPVQEGFVPGEFAFDGATPIGAIAEIYGFRIPKAQAEMPAGGFVLRHARGAPRTGLPRLHLINVDLVPGERDANGQPRVYVDLDPEPTLRRYVDLCRVWGDATILDPVRRRATDAVDRMMSAMEDAWAKWRNKDKD